MYAQRNLETRDLESICLMPQSEEELFYMSPRFVHPLTPEQILNIIKDRFEPTVIVVQKTDEVVAYANIYKDDSEESSFWLGNVIVSPSYRGKGAAQYLLDVMLDKAKLNLKIKEIRLACHNTNSRGLAFYSKYGFKPFDVKMTSTDAKKYITIHMIKELHLRYEESEQFR
ncbi:GNAT family N-acetyltransferase [Paenibacillus thalictri]|uniref:GNAT family N-acetyltransferase n=1 Tax=Paenibacillus thalictri TaxID=2527873 RepID=A0A4Q9DU41_9BACL|nr:GNAT family N-acetyltransferase [Paenibacillus thalictri]TBL78918.1 GNAT family N-acetyltransferase [Paenibacillus thalictri]